MDTNKQVSDNLDGEVVTVLVDIPLALYFTAINTRKKKGQSINQRFEELLKEGLKNAY